MFSLTLRDSNDDAYRKQIAKAVDEETVSRDLVPAFVKLLKDTEAEVRTAIAGQIPGRVLALQVSSF